MAISLSEQTIIDQAASILDREMKLSSDATQLTSPKLVRQYLRFAIEAKEHEVFVAIFLNTQHRVIESVELFRGTLDQASVYPREVAKEALKRNAGAVIFAHNHPSGEPEPSASDRKITERMKEALGLFDIKVLDHFVVGAGDIVSFAERGIL
ncbi:RadC family protein [Halomonas casei]|uniref:RadC family protein n=1 Tax=Halomonas casei TaxID=2742613 RepID=UPI003CEFEF9E